jgi:hypothetical protein
MTEFCHPLRRFLCHGFAGPTITPPPTVPDSACRFDISRHVQVILNAKTIVDIRPFYDILTPGNLVSSAVQPITDHNA